MAMASSLSSSLSTLSLRSPSSSLLSAASHHRLSFLPKPTLLSFSITRASSDGVETTFFDDGDPEEDDDQTPFNPPSRPDGFIAPRPFDEPPFESEDDIALAYEELYGPAYSGQSLLGKDVYVMDSKVKKASGFRVRKEKPRDGFDERVIQVSLFPSSEIFVTDFLFDNWW